MTIRDKYVLYRADPDNDDKHDSYFCSQHGVTLDELRTLKSTDQQLSQDVLDKRRDKYAKRMARIDEALFKAAERGDTKAADLLYRRFDSWNPRIVEETNNYYNFHELLKGTRKTTIIKRPIE